MEKSIINIVWWSKKCQYRERIVSRDYTETQMKASEHYRTVGAVMIPMKRIRHQLRG